MPPLVFRPLLKQRRWGGTRLGRVLGKPIGDATDVAESWELADHGDDQSVVEGGPYGGWTLNRLVRERNETLLGRDAGGEQFPLLVKFLDATDRLSVQVHPDDSLAKTFDPHENGKTEAWVVLDAEPDSVLYVGLREGVDEPALREAVNGGGDVEAMLHRIPVRPGDGVFVPAGTVHAIGEGVLLAEVQQSSDLTFRLSDWGRVGSDGKPRELHVAEALRCTDFARGPVDPTTPAVIADEPGRRSEELVRCERFVIRRHALASPAEFATQDRFRVLIAIEGSAAVALGEVTLDVPLGRTILLPASCGTVTVEPSPRCTLLETFLP